ncbi:MAG: RNA-binding S4 domain-containing protein [Azospirillum sp.]|nr:RNA-binding S4 domain-containing protein [Azospirillum sp.]
MTGGSDTRPTAEAGHQRLDKWLWQARFCKTRSLAAQLCGTGRLRCSGTAVTKPHHPVKPGDVLTFPLGRHIRVIQVLALGTRRGPAPEARTLYRDLDPPAPENALPQPAQAPWPREK